MRKGEISILGAILGGVIITIIATIGSWQGESSSEDKIEKLEKENQELREEQNK